MFEVVVLNIKTASVIFKDNASAVVLPGEDGEMTVLDFHQPFVTTLQKGAIRIDTLKMYIRQGIAGMKDNGLTILVEKI